MADAKVAASGLTLGRWLRERPGYAVAWVIEPITLIAYPLSIVLAVVGALAFDNATHLFWFGYAAVLPFLALFQRVRIDKDGTNVTDFWFVIPRRRRHYPRGEFVVNEGFTENEISIDHVRAPRGDEGIDARKPHDLAGWLNAQVARLQRTETK